MIGGAGNDTYIVDATDDVVVENLNDGIDTVKSSANYVLGANVEKLILTGAALTGTGNSLANELTGNTLANTLAGAAGDDTYIVDSTTDTLVENFGEGVDTVRSSASYTLGANLENLVLTGAAVEGIGNELANELTGNALANRLAGRAGNDTYIVDSTADTLVENAGEGLDTVKSSVSYTLGANLENLMLVGAAVDGKGNELNNALIGNASANTVDGAAGADAMSGGKGDDTYVVDNAADTVIENLNEGVDTVRSAVNYALGNNIEKLILTGTVATQGTGNALDNELTGNAALNRLIGGAGNDTYIVDATDDVVVENLNDGIDTVKSSANYVLGANAEKLILTGAALTGTGNALANELTGNTLVNTLAGAAGDDTYIVDSTTDTLVENFGEGVDTVRSSASYTLGANLENLVLTGAAVEGIGNELANELTGNALANRLAGRAGNDTYVVDSTADTIVENAGEGLDTVKSSVSYTLALNLENLTLTGTGVIDGKGNEFNNALIGNASANTLDGGVGADAMYGGKGDDTYVVDNAADAVFENLNEGVDTVTSAVNYALANNVEKLILTGTVATQGTGNALDNELMGNAALNRLIGGAGNDIYIVDATGDVVVENLNEGIDTVKSSATFMLGANVEKLILTGAAIQGTGNALDNELTGNAVVNILAGGAGNDTYIVDSTADTLLENVSEGLDTVKSSASFTLSANVENLILTGTATSATGNSLDNQLTGNTAANLLTGGAGNDLLDGREGADTMAGGVGNDTFIADNSADVISENAAEGTDLVQASADYTLAANVENLALTGTARTGTGNALNNMLTGNNADNSLFGLAGNDTIDGRIGNDTLVGGAGDDYYVVDSAGDIINEDPGEGTDSVTSSVTFTLVGNIENLALTGSALQATGNGLNNSLAGNAANNTLDGRAGIDTMSGGAGDDKYIVDNTLDLVLENAGQGIDTVESTVTYQLSINVEQLTLTGANSSRGTGNTLDNIIVGNAADNLIEGAAGNDRLAGGVGNDRLDGGAGDDWLDGGVGKDTMSGGVGNDYYVADSPYDVAIENAGEGLDTFASEWSYGLGANVENLQVTGAGRTGESWEVFKAHYILIWGQQFWDQNYDVASGALLITNGDLARLSILDGIGNDLNNVITGGAAKNSLTGNGGNDTLYGMDGDDLLNGGAGDDRLDGGDGADGMAGNTGNDTYVFNIGDSIRESLNEGIDTVESYVDFAFWDWSLEHLKLIGTAATTGKGYWSNNLLTGNTGSNTLDGGGGSDILEGMDGADILSNPILLANTAGNNLFNGGAGDDLLSGNSGRDYFIGGKGNDTITTSTGADIAAFNRGDGQDIVKASAGRDNTLSIGGGVRYTDMSFTKNSTDLVLNLGGTGEKITLQGWYDTTADYKSIVNMQVIVDAMVDFNAASTDKLVNKKIANFDFLGLAAAFDTAGAPASWALTNALLTKHLSGSDTAALGGDLAYRYGKSGSLANMGFDAAQGLLASASFGAAAQALQAAATLDAGVKRLS